MESLVCVCVCVCGGGISHLRPNVHVLGDNKGRIGLVDRLKLKGELCVYVMDMGIRQLARNVRCTCICRQFVQ